ncbi:hypothetical protein [Anaerotignum sp. MB30-C6]|uniref:hypothetical protein n=1 Tax=Anaerotignum sp. MB30-C6 TaxID=3070814 RepID=UPI0027DD25C1|nr:hypothetical protein [Anaerotignum sp. MB30-C6]WMI80945.1 hypothetical protein RBQ60_14160 [Anaerotignum sp. MB30-C6]
MLFSSDHSIKDVYSCDEMIVSNSATIEIAGILNGDVHLTELSTLVISGIMNGALTVNKGCTVEIHGILNANDIKNNGAIKIHGIVSCPSLDMSGLTISKNAIINGKQY